MISPIGSMTVDQIHERKDDLLFGIDDVKELARNEWNTAILEFSRALQQKAMKNDGGLIHVIEIVDIEANMMKEK